MADQEKVEEETRLQREAAKVDPVIVIGHGPTGDVMYSVFAIHPMMAIAFLEHVKNSILAHHSGTLTKKDQRVIAVGSLPPQLRGNGRVN